jgi:phosphorylase kinase alpha/beta subunit
MAEDIIEAVEYHLVRYRGVFRYKVDRYYNVDNHGGEEAEWTMGLPWLALAHLKQGNIHDAHKYILRTGNALHEGKLPELYYSNTVTPNGNLPLAWAEAMYAIALTKRKLQ